MVAVAVVDFDAVCHPILPPCGPHGPIRRTNYLVPWLVSYNRHVLEPYGSRPSRDVVVRLVLAGSWHRVGVLAAVVGHRREQWPMLR